MGLRCQDGKYYANASMASWDVFLRFPELWTLPSVSGCSNKAWASVESGVQRAFAGFLMVRFQKTPKSRCLCSCNYEWTSGEFRKCWQSNFIYCMHRCFKNSSRMHEETKGWCWTSSHGPNQSCYPSTPKGAVRHDMLCWIWFQNFSTVMTSGIWLIN